MSSINYSNTPKLVTFLGGIFFVVGLSLLFFVNHQKLNSLPFYVFNFIVVIFGLLMLLYRSGTSFSQSSNSITAWSGVVVPFSKSKYSISDFTHIEIRWELLYNNENGKSGIYAWKVYITNESKELFISYFKKLSKAEQFAESLSMNFQFKIVKRELNIENPPNNTDNA